MLVHYAVAWFQISVNINDFKVQISLLDLPSCDNLKPGEWWGAVLKHNNLPLVKRVPSAGLSLFTGPVIDGSFSETSNIIRNKRNSENNKN